VHENFLPALERCAVILSRLKGLAQFYDFREDMGLPAGELAKLMDTISSLTLLGHKILLHVMDELELFTAFSTWMRFQIDRLATERPSDDLTEKEATMDSAKVLIYIRYYLVESPMSTFFAESVIEDADLEKAKKGLSLLEAVDTQLRKQENGQPYLEFLTRVRFLVEHLDEKTDQLFRDIAGAQKRNVRLGLGTHIALGHAIKKLDSRMCSIPKEACPTGPHSDRD
jgi:anaphase-promoting complex subunit 4